MKTLDQMQADFQTRGISAGYWIGRGVPEEIILKYGFGFDDEKNAGTIPFYEGQNLVGIVGRRANSDNVKDKFFGYCFDRKSTFYFPEGSVPENPDTLLIVEGSLDAIYCREAGVENVVAQYCLVPNVYQLERLKLINPKRIVGLLDSDRAGKAAGEWFVKSLYPFFLAVETICLPQDGVDPWEYTGLEEFLGKQGVLSGNTNNDVS